VVERLRCVEERLRPCTSLATWQNKLILQLDQGRRRGGQLEALRLRGRQRASGVATVPGRGGVVGHADRRGSRCQAQVLTLAKPWAIAYSLLTAAKSGASRSWKAKSRPPDFCRRTFLVICPSVKLMALKPDGRGDVTKTHVLWSGEDGVPDVTSPVSNGELVFVVTTPGILTVTRPRPGRGLGTRV